MERVQFLMQHRPTQTQVTLYGPKPGSGGIFASVERSTLVLDTW